jgi:2,3,4,5-tetrahydropyridine-2-carboxylate N-succinyltransferase
LTASTKNFIDVTGDEPVEMKGYVPARSVVIPEAILKKFAVGEFQVPCALIIGTQEPFN